MENFTFIDLRAVDIRDFPSWETMINSETRDFGFKISDEYRTFLLPWELKTKVANYLGEAEYLKNARYPKKESYRNLPLPNDEFIDAIDQFADKYPRVYIVM